MHPRTLSRNIWALLLSATDQEIIDGMDFYPGAYGLCRLLSKVFKIDTNSVAGIYAALSPMNGWDENVSNIIEILRWRAGHVEGLPKVNTSYINRDKAISIALGNSPENVLRGEKVTAFYRAIADPDDRSSIPVDRHLICAAVGSKLSKSQLSAAANNRKLYRAVEKAYLDLGQREGIGNRLAAITWFVQRRVEGGQLPLYHPLAPVCCGIPSWSWGGLRTGLGTPQTSRRWYCPRCRSTQRPERALRAVRKASGWVLETGVEGFRVWSDEKGRRCVTLPKYHPYANSAGYQRLARFIIAESLGYLPSERDHTHHKDGDLSNDRVDNLELINTEYHGYLHGSAMVIGRGEDGRFKSIEHPEDVFAWPRDKAVLGNQARSE